MYEDWHEVYNRTRNIKMLHANYADKFRRGYVEEAIVGVGKRVWGNLPTADLRFVYSYDIDVATQKLLLAAFIAERYLLKRHMNLWKHLTVAIVGVGGAGKTTYSVLSYYGAMRMLGIPEDDAMSVVVSNTFFEPLPFLDRLEELLTRRMWVPAIILDDIGTQISKYWYMLGQRFWSHLFAHLDTLKDFSGVLVMTARDWEVIPSRLREITNIVVDATEVEVAGHVVDLFIYCMYRDYSKSGCKKPVFIDVIPFGLRIPDEIWRRMIETRRVYGLKRVKKTKEELIEHIKKELESEAETES